MKILEAHIIPVVGKPYIITTLVDDNGTIKAYQSTKHIDLDNNTFAAVAKNGVKLTFEEAVKLFPNISQDNYDL